MAISEEKLQKILTPLIEKINRLERQIETGTTQNEVQGISVVSDLGQVQSPLPNQVIVNKSDNQIYYFDTAQGWVVVN